MTARLAKSISGQRQPIGEFASAGTQIFVPPTAGPRDDWVLELVAVDVSPSAAGLQRG